MPKQRRDSIPALVLAVIAQVYELSGHRTQPWYIDRAVLDLGHASDSVNSSIYYAEVSGWLVGGRRCAAVSGVRVDLKGRSVTKQIFSCEDAGRI